MAANRKSSAKRSTSRDDAAPLTRARLKGGTWTVGGRRVAPAAGRAAFGAALGKRKVNMFLDAEVVDFFKFRAGGRGYQTLINDALREAMRREALAKTLRRVLREELHR